MFRSVNQNLMVTCALLLLLLWTNPLWAYEEKDCLSCHLEGSSKSSLTLDRAHYENSVHHKEITCTDCHSDIVDEAHMKQKGSGKVDCASCHDQENRHGLNRRGMKNRPQCQDCHTKHAILAKEDPHGSINRANFKKTCGSCHPAQFGDSGFMTWLGSVQIRTHGKQDFACDFDETDCLGCHQGMAVHGEETPVNNAQCWKCHLPKDDRARVMGDIHPRTAQKKTVYHQIAGILYVAAALVLMVGGCRFFVRRFSHKNNTGKGR